MIDNKTILIVVPARGGSKGIKLKNLQKIGGVSLVAKVGHIVNEISIVDRAIVSTDHKKIAEAARKSGLIVPFFRPIKLSGDRISDLEVLTQALLEIEKIDNIQYDIIVMLQPTSPSRTSDQVINTINKLLTTNADSVWTVSCTDSKAHPLKQLVIKNEEIHYYDKAGAKIIARQELTTTYHKNGIAYAMTRDCIINQKSIKGEKCIPLLINEPVVNIDTEFDLAFANFLNHYNRRKKKLIGYK